MDAMRSHPHHTSSVCTPRATAHLPVRESAVCSLHVLVVEVAREPDAQVELQLVQAVFQQVVDERDHRHHAGIVPGVPQKARPTVADQRTERKHTQSGPVSQSVETGVQTGLISRHRRESFTVQVRSDTMRCAKSNLPARIK